MCQSVNKGSYAASASHEPFAVKSDWMVCSGGVTSWLSTDAIFQGLKWTRGAHEGELVIWGPHYPTSREPEKNTRARDIGSHLLHRKVVAVNRTSLRATENLGLEGGIALNAERINKTIGAFDDPI